MKSPLIPAAQAFTTTHRNTGAKWPSKGEGNRLDPICAPHPEPSFRILRGETVFTIGSCFARNIEANLKRNGFKVPCWEFRVPESELWAGTKQVPGILNKYTPHSMLNEVQFAFGDTDGREYVIEKRDGWLDTQLHTNTCVSFDRALERRLEIRKLYSEAIRAARTVIITLGLVETWYDSLTETYYNEIPDPVLIRENPGRFFFQVMSVDDVRDVTFETLRLLKKHGREDQKVLLTVSPVPLARTFTSSDVIVANSYSKSALRVVAHEAAQSFDWVDYYSSYESVTLSDRSVAWNDDLIHASNQIIAHNVTRMMKAY